MWPFSKPTIEDVQNKAYLIYHEFGTKARIDREERLLRKFSENDRTTIKFWISQFNAIDKAIDDFVGPDDDFDEDELRVHLKGRFPFLNEKSLDRAAFLTWYSRR